HAALLLASILVAGALIVSSFQVRAERQAKRRDVEADLLKADRLARSSAWAQAAAVLDGARIRLGGDGPEDLGQRLNQEHDRIERARRRSELVQRVESARLTRATRVEGRFNFEAERRFRNERADWEYAGAFTTAGFGSVGDDWAIAAS